jgi:hypothetical protein
MGLIREPKNVDFTIQSKPWTDEELSDFRKLMTELKSRGRMNEFSIKKKKKVNKAKSASRKTRATTRKKVA